MPGYAIIPLSTTISRQGEERYEKQNTAVRRAALAVLYLAVFAAAVMYLRVTISVPAEGDDKLTLNGWLYDMGRMSFWQYALQDLKERLSFFY